MSQPRSPQNPHYDHLPTEPNTVARPPKPSPWTVGLSGWRPLEGRATPASLAALRTKAEAAHCPPDTLTFE
jgi:hypothetical protein